VDIAVGIPPYIGDDVKQQREVARGNLAVFTGFPRRGSAVRVDLLDAFVT